MRFSIDARSSTPPYEQLRAQIVDAVRSGALGAGEKLPTVRALAGELGLANNTVARSYRELEQDGVIETRGRQGSFVAHDGSAAERAGIAAAEDFVARTRQLGLAPADALALVERALSGPDRPRDPA